MSDRLRDSCDCSICQSIAEASRQKRAGGFVNADSPPKAFTPFLWSGVAIPMGAGAGGVSVGYRRTRDGHENVLIDIGPVLLTLSLEQAQALASAIAKASATSVQLAKQRQAAETNEAQP